MAKGNERISDLVPRELVVVAPLLALLFVLGVYPKPVLDIINPAVQNTMTTIGQHDPAPIVPRPVSLPVSKAVSAPAEGRHR